MKGGQTIVQSLKVAVVLGLVLFVFSSKNYFDLDRFAPKTEQKDTKKSGKEPVQEEMHVISFEAPLSFFTVEFDEIADFAISGLDFGVQKISLFEPELPRSYSTYFRILFLRITPINAP